MLISYYNILSGNLLKSKHLLVIFQNEEVLV